MQAFGPALRIDCPHTVPRRLPRVHRGETVLDERAPLRELLLLLGSENSPKESACVTKLLRAPVGEAAFTSAKNFRRVRVASGRESCVLWRLVDAAARRSETCRWNRAPVIGGGAIRWPQFTRESCPERELKIRFSPGDRGFIGRATVGIHPMCN